MKRKICFITGSRAEYGLLQPLMSLVREDSAFEMQLVVTGSHLAPELGNTYQLIEEDGFRIDRKIPILSQDDSIPGVTASTGRAITEFGRAYDELKPDMIVILGDRYEIFAAAQAALFAQIPIAHLCGGESTEGAFDEALRHSITKMAHLHFVTHEAAARRVMQLGENPQFIFNVGYTGLDYLQRHADLSQYELEEKLGMRFRSKNILVTFHPVTLDADPAAQFQELLGGLKRLDDEYSILFTKANADPSGQKINQLIDQFVSAHPNAQAFASLGPFYLSVMKQMDAVVGNSSSGIYEAPALGVPTINIGDRQKGRLMAPTVFQCAPEAQAIEAAIRRVLSEMSGEGRQISHLYGEPGASQKILEVLKSVRHPKTLIKKHFYDQEHDGSNRVYIIAEAGVNHNGDLETAKQLIETAAHAGADAVKFQTFRADSLTSRDAAKAEYQKRNTDSGESQWEMLKKLELGEEAHRELQRHARANNIDFLSTPFDETGLDFLADELKVPVLKISSGEITNAPLLLRAAQKGLPVILSTGMSTMEEVREALGVLAFGWTRPKTARPGADAFREAYGSEEGQKALKKFVTLLHCTTEYPAPFADINLRAMNTLAHYFGLRAGLSDHSLGHAVAVAAAARGAAVIEKHFTLNRNQPGPDHRASLEPYELKLMVEGIRQVELAMGSGFKAPAPSEIKNIPVARKSLVLARDIKKGEVFSEGSLTTMRPGSGISPMRFWDYVGKHADRDYKKGERVHA